MGITAGIEASQAAEDSSRYKSSISAKAAMSGCYCQPTWANTKNTLRETKYLESWKIRYLLLKILTTQEKRDEIFIGHIVWFPRILGHKSCPRFLKKKNVSQVQLRKKNTLWDSDQYPILCPNEQYTLIEQYTACCSHIALTSNMLWTSETSLARKYGLEGWPGPCKRANSVARTTLTL